MIVCPRTEGEMEKHVFAPLEFIGVMNGTEVRIIKATNDEDIRSAAIHGGEGCVATVVLPHVGMVEAINPSEQGRYATLFVAAPKLLAALECILRAHDTGNNGAVMGEAVLCPYFADMARAAIAEARGETA